MKLQKLNLNNTEQTNTYLDFWIQLHKERFPKIPPPTRAELLKSINAKERPNFRLDRFLLINNSQPIGCVELRTNKITDKDQFGVVMYLIPEYSSLKSYRELLQYIINEHTPASMNVITISGVRSIPDVEDPIEQVFFQMNGNAVYQERINVSEFQQFNLDIIQSKVEELTHKAENAGYKLVEIEDGGFKDHPEIDYPVYLGIVEAIWNDMPTEDANWDHEIVTEELYEAIFDNMRQRDQLHFSFVAIHKQTGKPVGMTDTWYNKDRPEIIFQGDTGVIRDHRGNQLGKTLKYRMLQKLCTDPRTRNALLWQTGNASSNKHMIAINDELGYSEWYREVWYEIPVKKNQDV